MAIQKEDQWILVAGLGAVAFGYWYYKSHDSTGTSSANSATDSTSADTSETPDIYIPSYDLAGNNVVGPNQIYYGGQGATAVPSGGTLTGMSPVTSSLASPAATSSSSMRTSTVASSGQALTLPANG